MVFILLPPLSHRELFAGLRRSPRWCAAWWSALGVLVVTCWTSSQLTLAAAAAGILAFALLGGALLGSLGVIAGIWAEKFDQMAAFQNFLIMPMTLLVRRVLFDPLAAGVLAAA